MKKRTFVICLIVGLAVCTAVAVERKQKEKQLSEKKTYLAVGVFDSRAVALAYHNSDMFRRKLDEAKKQMDKAKAVGDANKIRELEAWGRQGQKKAHLQGFGTADVSELLEYIKEQIPAIAKRAGVDIIVSKWNIAYQAEDVSFIDITDEIVKAYNPDEKAFKWIDDLKNQKPVPMEDLEKRGHTKF